MIVMKCHSCGKKVVWDDFQPMSVRCPHCRAHLDVRSSFKQNIREREMLAARKTYYCPHCKKLVSRRWFIRCPHCRHWLFGPASFSGKWPFVLGLALMYLLFALYYVIYVQ